MSPLPDGVSDQQIVEPQGAACSNGTIWLDPLPDDFRRTNDPAPPPVEDNRDFLDRLQGHGPFGLVNDPLAVPDASMPAECDEIDVGPDTPWAESMKHWWTRDLELFSGIHGFKGPFDQGLNGNFGFHGGFNFGAPLGICDWGWQIGSEVAVSNLTSGQTIDDHSENRTQFFVTGGIFRRARDWGFQWGVVYDWLHDAYYADADLKQIRSDSSFIFPGHVHEIGYFGAYGTGSGQWVLLDRPAQNFIFLEFNRRLRLLLSPLFRRRRRRSHLARLVGRRRRPLGRRDSRADGQELGTAEPLQLSDSQAG